MLNGYSAYIFDAHQLHIIHNPPNGTVLIFSAAYRHPVAIVRETHSDGAVCSSQLNY